jgi:hypothetical protein
MHKNFFLATPNGKKYLFWKNVSSGLEVCANAWKHIFNHSRLSKISFLIKRFWWSGSMCKCIKTRLLPLQTFKNIFFEKKFLVFLVVWKYVQMHQNSFLTIPNVQKYLFLKKSFWWSRCIRKCIKTRFKPLQTFKNIFYEKKFLVVWKYVQMHQNTSLTTPDCKKYLFWKKVSGGLEVCENASKHVFNHSRRSKISFWKKVSGGLEECSNASKHVFNHSRCQ